MKKLLGFILISPLLYLLGLIFIYPPIKILLVGLKVIPMTNSWEMGFWGHFSFLGWVVFIFGWITGLGIKLLREEK